MPKHEDNITFTYGTRKCYATTFVFPKKGLEKLIEKYEKIEESAINRFQKERISRIRKTAKYLLEGKGLEFIYGQYPQQLARTYFHQIKYDLGKIKST